VWNVADGKLVKRIFTRAERAYGMTFVADGKLVVASAAGRSDIRVYDINATGNGNGVTILNGVDDPVMLNSCSIRRRGAALAISPTAKSSRAAAIALCASGHSGGVLNANWNRQSKPRRLVLSVALAADATPARPAATSREVWDLAARIGYDISDHRRGLAWR